MGEGETRESGMCFVFMYFFCFILNTWNVKYHFHHSLYLFLTHRFRHIAQYLYWIASAWHSSFYTNMIKICLGYMLLMTIMRNMRTYILIYLINWCASNSPFLTHRGTLMWNFFKAVTDLTAMPANRWAVVRNANQVEIAKLLVISLMRKEAFKLSKINLFAHSVPSANPGLYCPSKRWVFQVMFYKSLE